MSTCQFYIKKISSKAKNVFQNWNIYGGSVLVAGKKWPQIDKYLYMIFSTGWLHLTQHTWGGKTLSVDLEPNYNVNPVRNCLVYQMHVGI
jgi:hypothetical protein